MVDIDMSREPESNLLVGTHLWTVKNARVEKSKTSGENMLVLTLKSGESEMTDRAMLGGGGWGIGKKKLLALGLPADFKGALDPIQFIGAKVWCATKIEPYQGIDKKTGQPRTFQSLKVDVDQLTHAGYQPEAMVPAGCTAPVEGWPKGDDTPF